MTFGMRTWRADGTPIVTEDDAGGLFVEKVLRARANGSGTVSYPQLNGFALRVMQIIPGCFSWAVGVDGAGNPYVTFTLLPQTVNEGNTLLIVFAI